MVRPRAGGGDGRGGAPDGDAASAVGAASGVSAAGAVGAAGAAEWARSRRAASLGVLAVLLLLPLVPAGLPAQTVPEPASFIGWEPGEDRKLADYRQILGYFRALDEASDRLRLIEIGETARDRPMVLAAISSSDNLGELDRYREISRRLALGEPTDSAEAWRLAREGRTIVWMDGGLHSTEVAGAQFMPAFAHRLVTEESEEMRRIRERTILLVMPVMNPDGLDIVAEWYRGNVGTEFETAALPRLYHEYVGHDNNRDWFMLLMPESRAVARQLWHVWHPQIVVNHHQTGALSPARIFIPPFADPVNPEVPPLVIANVNLVGTAMMRRFVEEGKAGAISRHRFTQWWNGGMRTAPYFHNQVGILTEVAVDNYATPRYHDPDSLPGVHARSGIPGDRASTWYPLPWEGGWWRLSDQVEYFLTASMAVADIAARRSDDWLMGAWRLARQAIERGEAGEPFAYLVSLEEQRDPAAAAEMLGSLLRGGAEIRRSTASFRAADRTWPAGTYVVPAAQPFRAMVVDLLEPQAYPDRRLHPGGPPAPPYDLAGWTLPIQMGVTVHRIEEPFRFRSDRVAPEEPPRPRGGLTGRGPVYLLDAAGNAAFGAVNDLLESGGRAVRVERATEPFEAAGRAWPPGTFLVRAEANALRAVAARHGVVLAGAGTPEVAARPVGPARVGLYRSWRANIDEGWTRWLLERYGFRFETITDREIREGDLSRFHAIVLPDQEADRILSGHPPGTLPAEYVGGVGAEGAVRLKAWVEEGGTLVALDGAADFAIRHLGLPVVNAVDGLSESDFFIPGSLIRLSVDPSHPVAWGMPQEAAAFFVRSRAFRILPAAGQDTPGRADVAVVARYAEESPLLSGWEMGAGEHLGGRAAVVRAALGRGEVVLVGFRPQFRAQPHGTFKLLFNPLVDAAGELAADAEER